MFGTVSSARPSCRQVAGSSAFGVWTDELIRPSTNGKLGHRSIEEEIYESLSDSNTIMTTFHLTWQP